MALLSPIDWGRAGLGQLASVIRSIIGPRLDALSWYQATVVSQSGMTVDVVPNNAALLGGGGNKTITIAVGVPGEVFTLDLSTKPQVMIAFAEGDFRLPFVAQWLAGAVTVRTLGVETTLNLGGTSGTHPVALGDQAETRIANLELAFKKHLHALTGASAAGVITFDGYTTIPHDMAHKGDFALVGGSLTGGSGSISVTTENPPLEYNNVTSPVIGTPGVQSSVVNTQ